MSDWLTGPVSELELPVVPSKNIRGPFLQACQLLFEKNDPDQAKRYAAIAFRLAKEAEHLEDLVLCHMLMAEALHKMGKTEDAKQCIRDAELLGAVDVVKGPRLDPKVARMIESIRKLLSRSRWERLMDDADTDTP